MTQAAGEAETRLQQRDVTVARTIEARERTSTVRLTLTSERKEPVAVRVVEELPTDAAVVTADSASRHRANERLGYDRLEFVVTVLPGRPVTVTYDLDRGPTAVEDGTLRISAIRPIEQETGTPDGRPEARLWADELCDVVELEREDPSTADWRVGSAASPSTTAADGGVARSTPGPLVGPEAGPPAIGLVATAENRDAVILSVARARGHDHPVYVAATRGGTGTAEMAHELGAIVVHAAADGLPESEARRRLEERARADGAPGIYFPVGDEPLTFETSAVGSHDGEWADPASDSGVAVPSTTDVVVAIPAYNAAGTVGDVVRSAREHADLVVVVDDGSSDGTGREASEAGALVVAHRRNRGYGGALKTAFREAHRLGANHLVLLDADGQHDPADVPRLVAAQRREDAEIVIGSRYVDGSRSALPLTRRIGLGVVNVLTNLSLGHLRPSEFLHDTQSGFRSYDRDAIESLATRGDLGNSMEASTDIIYHANRRGFEMHEVGISISYEVDHGSTLNPVAHGWGLVRNIFYTLTVVHPFLTLGMLGGVCASIGTGVALEGFSIALAGGDLPFLRTYAAMLVAGFGFTMAIVAIEYSTLQSHPYYRSFRE